MPGNYAPPAAPFKSQNECRLPALCLPLPSWHWGWILGWRETPPKRPSRFSLGNWTCLNVLILDLALYVSMGEQARWLKIALRVTGSWIIAIGLMVLAFTFRK